MSARALALGLCLASTFVAADPSGKKWPLGPCGTGCPMGTTCVSTRCVPQFRQAASVDNAGGTTINGGLPYATAVSRTQAAFAAWTTGRVGCNTSWNSVPVASYSSPAGTLAVNGMDRFNNVIWLSGSSWRHLSNELALTTTTYFTSNNEIFDADLEMNNNLPWSDNQAANTYDAESVILHEAGHFLGLNHTAASNAVMFATVNIAEAKRVLTTLDATDVCTVYPGQSGGQGFSCTADSQCTSPLVCRARSGATDKQCTSSCTTSSTCPTGYTCQAANQGMACLPQVGVPDQCRFCQTGGECSSGLCLRFDTGVTFCSLSCSDSAQCGPNYTCQLPDGFCVPNALTCTNQCTTANDCASGYTCNGGTCTPRGDTGDPCTVSLYCKACNVCTRESAASTLSFCRGCCAGQGQGGFCDACPNTSCGASNTCVSLTTGNSSVCLPGSSAPTSCQPCNAGQCAEGLACVAGRCRASCNPAAPGTCSACYTLTSGGGACACNDEIGAEGEPCGQIGANTLAACGAGLACVGSTSTVCRTRCELNNPGSCRTGQVCQLMNGLAVCVPGTEGSTCANITNAGTCNTGLTAYLGRCYQPCNVNTSGACATCVQTTAGGVGICGCPDQISPENGPCGTQPDVHACQTGTACLDGVCRPRCDPMNNLCPANTNCTDLGGGNFYCVDSTGSGGGGGSSSGGGGGNRTGGGGGAAGGAGGAGGGGTTDLGCGCGASGTPLGALVFGIVALLRRRRVSAR